MREDLPGGEGGEMEVIYLSPEASKYPHLSTVLALRLEYAQQGSLTDIECSCCLYF